MAKKMARKWLSWVCWGESKTKKRKRKKHEHKLWNHRVIITMQYKRREDLLHLSICCSVLHLAKLKQLNHGILMLFHPIPIRFVSFRIVLCSSVVGSVLYHGQCGTARNTFIIIWTGLHSENCKKKKIAKRMVQSGKKQRIRKEEEWNMHKPEKTTKKKRSELARLAHISHYTYSRYGIHVCLCIFNIVSWFSF